MTASGVFIHGSPPSKRQTLRPSASSSMTRLRTRTISEKPTLSNRRAGRGTLPSLMRTSSDDAPTAGSHGEVQDHADEGQQDDEQHPQDLGGAVGRALQDRHDRDDVEDENEDPDQTEHGR